MNFFVDPWDPSYGSSLEGELEQATTTVDAWVERPADAWEPIDPAPGAVAAPTVLFVDGVRRTDAQAWVDEPDGTASPALCASYAAGVICCCADGGAHLVVADVRRGLVTTSAAGVDVVTRAGTYRCTRTDARPGTDPAALLSAAVQKDMGEIELLAAVRARDEHGAADDLLVVDGRLRGRVPLPRTVGFVKTHGRSYLEPSEGAVVAALRAGQRTPVFRIGGVEADPVFHRYTWYLRLPCAPGAPWAGVVRVECGAELPAAEAVALAERSQVTLVRFASTEYKDSRAPQNLYPIAGLERALRRRLGEPAVLYRALRSAAARSTAPAPA